MKIRAIPSCAMFVASCTIVCSAQTPGGFSRASVTKKELVNAASFAIKAEEKALRNAKGDQPVKLELVKIAGAEEQVVAGINYRLNLSVKLNGKEKNAETTVWWQAWRRPDPYQLTSWDWK
jgi:hypothetical protein